MDYSKLFPQHLQENPDYSVFIRVVSDELSITTDYIELYPTLIDIQSCPDEFLPLLASNIGYTYKYQYSPNQNRSAMLRVWEANKARGSKSDLEMMAAYGDNQGYVGGQVFIPGTYSREIVPEIRIPRNLLFKHSVSKRSSTHHYPNASMYNIGVLEIVVANRNITKYHKDRIESVKPAGLKLLYAVEVNLLNSDDYLIIKDPVVSSEVTLYQDLSRSNGYARFGNNRFSRLAPLSYGGRQTIFQQISLWISFYIDTNIIDKTSILPKMINETEGEKQIFSIPSHSLRFTKGKPKYSVDVKYNHKMARSGTRVPKIEMDAIAYRNPYLGNPYYDINKVQNEIMNDRNQIDIQVKIEDILNTSIIYRR